MNSLVGIDTTTVYHHFDFSFDQVKKLKCDQWFIHIDVINWIEKELNQFASWNAIKILHNEIHHFDLNYLKCLDIYYKEMQWNPMVRFLSNAQFKMQWKGETIYYTRWFRLRVDEQLQKVDLQKYLIKSYEMKVDWSFEVSLIVYEFQQDLSNRQKLMLDEIFKMKDSLSPPIFISPNFLFLKLTKPPIIMKTEIFVAYHGEYLADLNLEDILALDLANKDHRLPFYDHDLDHDIQMHLQTRLPMFYKNKKLKTYFANKFTNSKLLKYFIYKYQHCLSEVIIPHQMLSSADFELITCENNHLKIIIWGDNNICVNISSGNITVCSMTYRTSSNDAIDVSGETAPLIIKNIDLDQDTNYNFNYFIGGSFPYNYIELFIPTASPPATLSSLIRKLLGRIEQVNKIKNVTIRLTALNHHIETSILNIFLNRPIDCIMEFKNITFDLQSLMKWLSKITNISSVSFIDCQVFRINPIPKVRKTYFKPHFALTFKNMNVDLHLSLLGHTIVYDNCHIVPSTLTMPSWIVDTVSFKNMRIEFNTIAALKCWNLVFQKCQIESLLECNSTMGIRHQKKIAKLSNFPVDIIKIVFKNMDTDITTLYRILYKFDTVEFINARILRTDNVMTKISIKLPNLRLTEMLIVPELINNLKYFEVQGSIELRDCKITNTNLLEIWKSNRNRRLIISGTHQIDRYFYLELIATLYENKLDELHQQFKDGIYFPFENFIKIEKWQPPFRNVDWSKIKSKCFRISDITFKIEFYQYGKVIDLSNELNELPDDSEICQIDYY